MAQDRALHLVLDLRKKEEEKAQELFVQTLQEVARYEKQIAQIYDYKKLYADEMAAAGARGFSAVQLTAYNDFIHKLEVIAERQEQELLQLRQVSEQRRAQYLEKQQQRKVIETLIQKHEQARIKAELKAEQKLLDEYVTARAARQRS